MGDLFYSGSRMLIAAEEGGGHEGPNFLGLFVYFGVVIVFLFATMSLAKGGLKDRVFKNKITQWFEQLYLFIEKTCVGTIGDHGRKYIPIVITFWMVIFTGNTLALFMPTAPTADLSFNLAMALIAIAYVQYEGMKTNGVFGHLKHFAGPKLPAAMAILITPIIFSIEIISELMKNVSLTLRLFGNIHGGHVAVENMNNLGKSVYIPFGFFLMPIKLLTCVVQAMIFSLLLCVYLSLVTHHDHEEAGDAHEAAAH